MKDKGIVKRGSFDFSRMVLAKFTDTPLSTSATVVASPCAKAVSSTHYVGAANFESMDRPLRPANRVCTYNPSRQLRFRLYEKPSASSATLFKVHPYITRPTLAPPSDSCSQKRASNWASPARVGEEIARWSSPTVD